MPVGVARVIALGCNERFVNFTILPYVLKKRKLSVKINVECQSDALMRFPGKRERFFRSSGQFSGLNVFGDSVVLPLRCSTLSLFLYKENAIKSTIPRHSGQMLSRQELTAIVWPFFGENRPLGTERVLSCILTCAANKIRSESNIKFFFSRAETTDSRWSKKQRILRQTKQRWKNQEKRKTSVQKTNEFFVTSAGSARRKN